MQQVTPGIGDAFGPVEEEIETAFFPELFKEVGDGAPGKAITCLPVKQVGLALPDPKRTAPDNWQAYCVITVHLVSSGGFSSLTRGMRSMRRTGQPCYGLYVMSGPVEHSLPLTATDNGTRLRVGTQQTGQATSCTARRE